MRLLITKVRKNAGSSRSEFKKLWGFKLAKILETWTSAPRIVLNFCYLDICTLGKVCFFCELWRNFSLLSKFTSSISLASTSPICNSVPYKEQYLWYMLWTIWFNGLISHAPYEVTYVMQSMTLKDSDECHQTCVVYCFILVLLSDGLI